MRYIQNIINKGGRMMTKFHINKKGVPSPCKAEIGNCPYGGEESHYNSEQEAQTKADEIAREEFGLLGEVKPESGDMDKIKENLGKLTIKLNDHVKQSNKDVEDWLEETK